MFTSSRMHYNRSGNNRHLPSPLPYPFQFPSDLTDHQLDFALAADACPHKGKLGQWRAANSTIIARFALAHGLDSLNADDNLVTDLQIAQKTYFRNRVTTFKVIDHNATIHALPWHPQPLPPPGPRSDRSLLHKSPPA